LAGAVHHEKPQVQGWQAVHMGKSGRDQLTHVF
jgi:hypothetical protein